MTDLPTWQVTLHDAEDAIPYVGTFFSGTPEDAVTFALSIRERGKPVWIRIEHIPSLLIIQ